MIENQIAPLFAAPDTAPATSPEPAAAGETVAGPDIFARAVVLQLQFRRLGTQRKVSTELIDVRRELTETDQDARTDKSLLRVSKFILDSPELKAIEKHDGETARYIEARKSGPAFANQGGFHLIANALKPEIDDYLGRRIRERDDLIAGFLDVYPQRCAATDRRLGPLAPRDRETVAEARAAFGVTYRYLKFGYTDENAARQWQAEALDECRGALRAAFAKIVAHLADRLKPGEDGKPRVFRDSLLEKFDEFAASFAARNIADDQELAELVRQARDLMSGVTANDLRKREGLRNAVAARIAEIKAAVDPMVTTKGTRGYFDE